jgi:hypothetical protein
LGKAFILQARTRYKPVETSYSLGNITIVFSVVDSL